MTDYSLHKVSSDSHASAIAPAIVGPELVFGLVGAIGTDLERLGRILEESLADVSYRSETVRLSDLLRSIPAFANLPSEPLDLRYREHMNAGTTLREKTGRRDAMAVLGIQAIRHKRTDRMTLEGTGEGPPPRVAYVIHSLKRPEEVATLKKVYSPGFFVISAYAPREKRLARLEERIASSHHVSPATPDHKRAAEELVQTDEKEIQRDYGQSVRDTFPQADLFVDVSASEPRIRRQLKRFIALLFGYPYHTPSRDESAMFHAKAAAVRSSEMGRQVGAAITRASGELVAVGTNDVPRAGGGLYWEPENDETDDRDFVRGEDTSDRMKRNNLAEILDSLRKAELLNPELAGATLTDLIARASPFVRSSRVMNAIEFGRAVHAEMDALSVAARSRSDVTGCTLYTTTFPCHNCAKHIVAAGITRVVYIEPYAKSLATEFHQDSIGVEDRCDDGRVQFEPFVGVAPRCFLRLFQMGQRKDAIGKKVAWDRSKAQPRIYPPNMSYRDREAEQGAGVDDALINAGLATSPTATE